MIPFQKINDAVRTTGLSAYFLRNGCKNGTIPHIMSGKKYLINIPALLKMLDADYSETNEKALRDKD